MITIAEIEAKIAKLESEEHAALGDMLKSLSETEKQTSIATNWQGGRVNGIRLALEIIRKELDEVMVWEKVSQTGRDIQAKTKIGTYTISVDSFQAGGRAYLWTPQQGNDENYSSEYGFLSDAKEAAEKHYRASCE